jgi:uncharacterized membrane protein YuzA (DUF378 family)
MYTIISKLTKVPISILNICIYKVKYLVVGLAAGAVVFKYFKFESKDKSSHLENDFERYSVHYVCVRHISNLKHL